MIRILKKIFNKFTISLSIALITICSLFAITKTYAYDYNDNTNQLVGNNVFSGKINNVRLLDYTFADTTVNNMSVSTSNDNIILSLSGSIVIPSTTYIVVDTDILFQSLNLRYASFGAVFNVSDNSPAYFPCGIQMALKYQGNYVNTGYRSVNIGNYALCSQGSYCWLDSQGSISNTYIDRTVSFIFYLANGISNHTYNTTITIKPLLFQRNYNIDYFINNTQTFIPYSSVEQLQEDYNTLLGQYNDLQLQYSNYQNTHSYTDDQYNLLVSRISTLEQLLTETILQYNVYVATHSHTNEDYQTLLNQYQNLQSSYNSLSASYNLLLQENELLKQIPKNYFTYIIGNNYFINSNTVFNQRVSDFNGTLKIGAYPLDTPNTFIEGNKLYLSQLFNYSFDNSMTLDNNLNQVHVYNSSDYSTSNFTYLSLFPHYSLPSNVRSTGSLPLKYVNLIINGSNYNGNIRITTQIPNSNNPNTYEYINISKNSDDNYIIDFPDSDNFLISIDIQATYTNGSYNIPTEIISNVEQVNAVSDYQIGYDTAKSEYSSLNQDLSMTIETLNLQITQLQNSLSSLQSSYNSLQTSYNNYVEGDNFVSLFFTIAETPFSSFKQIWNVDFLGVNLSGFVTGLLFIGLMIWLVKKIF